MTRFSINISNPWIGNAGLQRKRGVAAAASALQSRSAERARSRRAEERDHIAPAAAWCIAGRGPPRSHETMERHRRCSASRCAAP